jgi:YfiH family protein
MQKFYVTQRQNVWFGSFPEFTKAGFINGCACRLHGESELAPGSLNLALHVGDNPELVVRNRKKFCEALGVDIQRLTTCQQVHGSKVVQVDEHNAGSGALDVTKTIPDTDALVTNVPHTPLMLFFADCVPILLVDPVKKAIGLAHGGWRGSVAGIAAKTVQKMVACFGSKPEDILAGIGPSICGKCYEVDDAVLKAAKGHEDCFTPHGEGKYLFDLWKLNRTYLEGAGVPAKNIITADVCTYMNNELFFSFRKENGKTGRMGVCLCIDKE